MRDGHVGDHTDEEGRVCAETCRECEETVQLLDCVQNFGGVYGGFFFDGIIGFGWRRGCAFGDGLDGAVFEAGELAVEIYDIPILLSNKLQRGRDEHTYASRCWP
jgi:hypothetical protein